MTYSNENEVRRLLGEGKLVPSEFPREFTIALGPASRPPEKGDIWLLAGSPYVVSEVTGKGPTLSGTLRYLTEKLPGSN